MPHPEQPSSADWCRNVRKHPSSLASGWGCNSEVHSVHRSPEILRIKLPSAPSDSLLHNLPCLASFLSLSHVPSPLPMFSGITFHTDHLDVDSCLRIWSWENQPKTCGKLHLRVSWYWLWAKKVAYNQTSIRDHLKRRNSRAAWAAQPHLHLLEKIKVTVVAATTPWVLMVFLA